MSKPIINLVGKRFGTLVVKKYFGKSKGGHQWYCVCDCGNERWVYAGNLASGATRGCGRGCTAETRAAILAAPFVLSQNRL